MATRSPSMRVLSSSCWKWRRRRAAPWPTRCCRATFANRSASRRRRSSSSQAGPPECPSVGHAELLQVEQVLAAREERAIAHAFGAGHVELALQPAQQLIHDSLRDEYAVLRIHIAS